MERPSKATESPDPLEQCIGAQSAAAPGRYDSCRFETPLREVEPLEAVKTAPTPMQNAIFDLSSLVDNIPDVIYALDEKGAITVINRAVNAFGYLQEELTSRFFLDLVHDNDRERIAKAYFSALTARQTRTQTQQFRILTKSGEVRWLEVNCGIRFNPQGQFIMHEGVCRDITNNVNNQKSLSRDRELLEAQVRTRTDEILHANIELQREIDERRTTEKMLRDRESELEMEKANLQEANTALKVLLKRRELDKRALEERVISNINRLVLPYLKTIRRESSDNRHRDYVRIVESNLNDITCNFSRRLSLGFYSLSTAELKVANFIRQGKKSRDIAHLLGLSPRTVDTYRQSIRHKLRIRNKNINLRTFLMSIK